MLKIKALKLTGLGAESSAEMRAASSAQPMEGWRGCCSSEMLSQAAQGAAGRVDEMMESLLSERTPDPSGGTDGDGLQLGAALSLQLSLGRELSSAKH